MPDNIPVVVNSEGAFSVVRLSSVDTAQPGSSNRINPDATGPTLAIDFDGAFNSVTVTTESSGHTMSEHSFNELPESATESAKFPVGTLVFGLILIVVAASMLLSLLTGFQINAGLLASECWSSRAWRWSSAGSPPAASTARPAAMAQTTTGPHRTNPCQT